MISIKYTKTGRIFSLPTGQRMWTGKVRQQNIQLPDSSFVPYVYDSIDQSVRYGNMIARFRPQGIQILNAQNLRTTIQVFPEKFTAGQWRRVTTTRNPLSVIEALNTDIVNNSRDYFHATLQAGTNDVVVHLRLRIAGSNKIEWQTRIKATNPGRYRAMIEFGGMSNVPQPIIRFQPGSGQTIILPSVKYKLGNLIHAWRHSEQDDHTIDGDISITRIGLGDKQYIQDEEKIISPDTTGEASIGNDSDDGDEIAPTWDNQGNDGDGNLYLVDLGGAQDFIGLGWRAIDLNTATPGVDSIDVGTQIHCFNGGVNSNPGGVPVTLNGVNSSGTVWGSANRPSQQTPTTATVAVTPTAADQNISCDNIVSEWVINDGLTYEGATGEDMYLYLERTGGQTDVDFWSGCQDYDGAGAAEETGLTIVFTPTVAGGIVIFRRRIEEG